jgi:hypothetical protein
MEEVDILECSGGLPSTSFKLQTAVTQSWKGNLMRLISQHYDFQVTHINQVILEELWLFYPRAGPFLTSRGPRTSQHLSIASVSKKLGKKVKLSLCFTN